jgi:hypothetical protein
VIIFGCVQLRNQIVQLGFQGVAFVCDSIEHHIVFLYRGLRILLLLSSSDGKSLDIYLLRLIISQSSLFEFVYGNLQLGCHSFDLSLESRVVVGQNLKFMEIVVDLLIFILRRRSYMVVNNRNNCPLDLNKINGPPTLRTVRSSDSPPFWLTIAALEAVTCSLMSFRSVLSLAISPSRSVILALLFRSSRVRSVLLIRSRSNDDSVCCSCRTVN